MEEKNKNHEKIEEKKAIETEKDEVKVEKKEEKVEKIKKHEAHIDVKNLRISTKQSMAICDYIRGKSVDYCILFLEKVIKQKKALPMKGEIPHRKGNIMAGRFPVNSSSEFIRLLKSLKANTLQNGLDIDKCRIIKAVANKGNKMFRRGGREKAKRTHVYIGVKETNNKNMEDLKN